MAEDKKPAPKQKPWKIVVTIVTIACIIAAIGAYMRKKENTAPSGRTLATQPVVSEMHSKIIGSERFEIKIPFGKMICFEPETENVEWWVMINRDEAQKYLRPPVNSPEYKSKDYGKDLRFVTVWANPGQAYTLNYYFVPASR